jgi:hypothetical protein
MATEAIRELASYQHGIEKIATLSFKPGRVILTGPAAETSVIF